MNTWRTSKTVHASGSNQGRWSCEMATLLHIRAVITSNVINKSSIIFKLCSIPLYTTLKADILTRNKF